MARVTVVDFGPLGRATVTLRPLTMVIGQNSLGKSMLLYLLWALTATPPDTNVLLERVGGVLKEYAGRVQELPVGAELSLDGFINTFIDAFPAAWSSSLAKELQRMYGVSSLRELVREGREHARAVVEGDGARLVLELGEGLEARWDSVERPRWVRARVTTRGVEILHGDEVITYAPSDVPGALLGYGARVVARLMRPFITPPP